MRQIVQAGNDVPTVHLALIDLLGAVIFGRIAKPDRVGRREETEELAGANDLALIEQGHLAFDFKNPLDHEHHIRAARIVFVETKRAGLLQCPGQIPSRIP